MYRLRGMGSKHLVVLFIAVVLNGCAPDHEDLRVHVYACNERVLFYENGEYKGIQSQLVSIREDGQTRVLDSDRECSAWNASTYWDIRHNESRVTSARAVK